MTTIEQIKDLHKRIDTLRDCLDISGKRAQVESLQKKTEAADFWDDPKAAQAFLKNLSRVKAWVIDYDKAHSSVEDLDVLYEFNETEDLDTAYAGAVKQVEDLELKNMLGAEGDNYAGPNGTATKPMSPAWWTAMKPASNPLRWKLKETMPTAT